ncbi:MAG: ERF family protein [Thermosipho sp. (in: Bacteria)]|nr:ERF family protein [Thermosipho sp. (in: thermotogales)]
MSVKVARKINEVMKKVGYLQKDGTVSYKSTRYNYLSEEKVTAVIREALIEVGLIILPIEVETEFVQLSPEKNNNLTQVKVRYLIMDIDSGESIQVISAGQGADTQDKGIAKAMTMAFKYVQRQTFAIPTGDDPDHTPSAELDDTLNHSKNGSKNQYKNNGKITEKEAEELEELIKLKGVDKEKVLSYYKVKDIKDMTKLQLEHCRNYLKSK